MANDGMADADKGALEGRDEPFEAVVYFQGVSAYQAEIWQTRQVRLSAPLIRFTYWIIITDPGFSGRVIADSLENEHSKLDITFREGLMRDIQGFQYRHLAGSAFRVRFTFDTEQNKVVYQDLTM